MLRKRMEYPELKRAVREQWQSHRATVVLIEDKASGTQLIQELIAEGLSAITRYLPEHDKVMRLYAQTATIENGFVYLPREASWLAEYLHELTTFPMPSMTTRQIPPRRRLVGSSRRQNRASLPTIASNSHAGGMPKAPI